MPPNTIYVGRPSRWGNPFEVDIQSGLTQEIVTEMYKNWVLSGAKIDLDFLRGKDLACWCKPGEFCHADVLLEFANANP